MDTIVDSALPSRRAEVETSSPVPPLPVELGARDGSREPRGPCATSPREGLSRTSSRAPAREDIGAEVKLHVYHCDQYTGFLNNVLLKQQEIGIYHAGVEVYGAEWSFQYFEDTWDDPTVSGVIRCRPRSMEEYEFQETISLGYTPLSEDEVDQIVWQLYCDWPACSYHLTRQNCITFAETLVKRLQTPKPFPAWLKGIVDASNNRQAVDAVVDYSWSWMKWWMARKHHQTVHEVQGPAPEVQGQVSFKGNPAMCGSIWTLLLSPGAACTGGSLCPGGRRVDGEEPQVVQPPPANSPHQVNGAVGCTSDAGHSSGGLTPVIHESLSGRHSDHLDYTPVVSAEPIVLPGSK